METTTLLYVIIGLVQFGFGDHFGIKAMENDDCKQSWSTLGLFLAWEIYFLVIVTYSLVICISGKRK